MLRLRSRKCFERLYVVLLDENTMNSTNTYPPVTFGLRGKSRVTVTLCRTGAEESCSGDLLTLWLAGIVNYVLEWTKRLFSG